MRPRLLTRDDVKFTLEMKSEGVPLNFIAWHVFRISPDALRGRLKSWGAW